MDHPQYPLKAITSSMNFLITPKPKEALKIKIHQLSEIWVNYKMQIKKSKQNMNSSLILILCSNFKTIKKQEKNLSHQHRTVPKKFWKRRDHTLQTVTNVTLMKIFKPKITGLYTSLEQKTLWKTIEIWEIRTVTNWPLWIRFFTAIQVNPYHSEGNNDIFWVFCLIS